MSPDQRGSRCATSSRRAIMPSTPSMNSAAPSKKNIRGQFFSMAAMSANNASAAPDAVKIWTENASIVATVSRTAPGAPSADIAAPVEPHQLCGTSGEIPVAAEGAHARGLGARDRHILADPIAGIADDDVLARLLAFDRLHHPFDDFRDLEDMRAVFDVVDDGLGTHAKKAADEDFQQAGRAAGLSAEDARQRLHSIDRGFVVHV